MTTPLAKRRVTALFATLGWCLAAPAQAMLIDLNDFFADPTVGVAADGASATLSEDAFISPVLLSNDPGLGDPEVILPGPGARLSFQYDFTEPAGNDDEFGAFLLDGNTGLSLGPGFEFFTRTPGSGLVSFDLSTLTRPLGLQFQLSALFGDGALDSTVAISNVTLAQARTPVPLPSTLWLLALAGAWMGFGIERRG